MYLNGTKSQAVQQAPPLSVSRCLTTKQPYKIPDIYIPRLVYLTQVSSAFNIFKQFGPKSGKTNCLKL